MLQHTDTSCKISEMAKITKSIRFILRHFFCSELWSWVSDPMTTITRTASPAGPSWPPTPGRRTHVVCGSCRYLWPRARTMPWIPGRFSSGPWFCTEQRTRHTTSKWWTGTSTLSCTRSSGSTKPWERRRQNSYTFFNAVVIWNKIRN